MNIVSNSVLDEFAEVATILDKPAFSARLSRVINQEVERKLEQLHGKDPRTDTSIQSFRAEKRWKPSATDLQRGRALMLKEFRKPLNLPVADFAQLAGKSRQQIYKDVEMRRLLALSIGARGQRIPDWQLDETRKKLTQALLKKAHDVDEWTLYYALSEPSDALSGKSPVDIVSAGNLGRVLAALLAQLDIHD
ncbi:MAG: integrase [Thiobacillaceae bacterium]